MAKISVVMFEGRMHCVSKEVETPAVIISPALEKETKYPNKPSTPQNTNVTLVAIFFEFLMLQLLSIKNVLLNFVLVTDKLI